MNNEPVAELVLEQMAVGDASSLRVKWLVDNYPPVGTKLYTHPVKELDIKYDVTVKWDDKTTHHTNVSGDTPLHHTHPAKELTQGEIHAVWASGQYYTLDKEGNVDEIRFEEFARAILLKAREQ